jgi:hypothetical protein
VQASKQALDKERRLNFLDKRLKGKGCLRTQLCKRKLVSQLLLIIKSQHKT